jgi:cellulose synthase operon protein C
MENQRRIGERMLYAAARNTHDSATTAREEYEAGGSRDPELEREYREHYDRAIALYQSFLDQFPESEHTYEVNFNLAEAYFWSGQYLEAADQYRWVRDARSLSEARFASAALGVIQSYEAAIALRVDAGELSPVAVPTAEELRALPQPVRPRTIPELYLALQTAWDEYQQLITDPRTAPQMALNAALVSVSYHHLDDAIRRFDVVMTRFCGSDQATRAKDGILAIYDARGDEDAFRELNQRFITSKCGDAQAIELARAQNRSLEFRRAEEAFAARNYEEAARLFYVYYRSAPEGDDDLPTALFNAAVAYKQADKPKTALHLFKEFTDNKTDPFRKSGYFTEALRLQAVSHQSQYDYRAAVTAYLQLVDVARTAARDGLTPPPPLPGEPPRTFEEIRLDALYNAAVMYELNRDFKNAVELYRRYEAQEPDRRRKDRALWAVARTYRIANDVANLNRTYDEWRRKYGRDAGNENDFVFTFYDSARAFARIGRTADADRFRRQTIDAWKTVGSPTNTVAARLAGEYDLLFAERQFSSKFEPYRITTTARTEAQAKSLREGLDRITKETQDRYRALADYGVPEYAMAAKVRIGQTLVLYATKLFAMPTPRYILDLDRRYPAQDVLMKYEEGLSTNLAPLPQEARKEWVEVLQLARQRNVSNDWTRLALENLNREFPDEFPILHQELVEGTEEP